MTIERPSEASTALFWRPPADPIPVHTAIVVGDKECVVATLHGAILGVITPGAHSLHPQSFPFLATAVDAGSRVTAELWFVRTSPFQGIPFGGPLGATYDPVAKVKVSPSVVGEYSLTVIDPIRFVTASMSMNDADAVLAALTGVFLRKMKEVFGQVVAQGHMVVDPRITKGVTEALPSMLSELEATGVMARLNSFNINVPEEDRKALVAANAAKAKEHRDAMVARMQAQAAVGAPAPVVASPMAVPPVAAAPVAGAPGVAAMQGGAGGAQPGMSKTGLFVGIALAGVILVSGGVALVLHLTQGESHDKAHDTAQHDSKHGKH
jgi:membrane protease subunit (stomatin/prohibitin family)